MPRFVQIETWVFGISHCTRFLNTVSLATCVITLIEMGIIINKQYIHPYFENKARLTKLFNKTLYLQFVPRKGSDQRMISDIIYTSYLSLCTQTAVLKFPNPFQGTHCTLTIRFSVFINSDLCSVND